MRRLAFLLPLSLAACPAGTEPARRTPVPSPTVSRSPASAAFDGARVVEVVRALTAFGPRETTSPAFRRAGSFVERRFRSLGYEVSRETFRVPAGLSNFVSVPAGETFNLIATPRGFDPGTRHLIVGAHLDTVPQAPGAVDNATGIGIMLELARLASIDPPPVPVVFIAFGGEEARVPNGGLHGSKAYADRLDAGSREDVIGAIVIDRVGTASRVPVCTASRTSDPFARRFLDGARRLRIPATACRNASSDHLSFERAGIRAVRIGPDEFPEYHTARDVPAILVEAQARRAGVLVWETIRSTV